MADELTEVSNQETQDDQLINPTNYADTPYAGEIATELVGLWKQVVSARGTLNDRMYQFYNIWNTVFDIQYYTGNSQVYIPALRKSVEFATKNLRRNLFPTEDYFSVSAVDIEEDEPALKIKRFQYWQHQNQIKLKRYVTPWLRQLVTYGWSPVRVMWNKQVKNIYALEKAHIPVYTNVADEFSGELSKVQTGTQNILKQVRKNITTKQYPTFEPVDVFSFYLWPITVWNVEDADIVFEELFLSKSELLRYRDTDGWLNVDKLLETPPSNRTSEHAYDAATRQQTMGFPDLDLKEVPRWKVMFAWAQRPLQSKDGEIFDCQFVVGEDKISLVHRQNPHYDQEPPYLVGKLDELVGEFYSHGLIEPLQTMQYLLNDHGNQANDYMTYGLNPIVKYRPGAVANMGSIIFAPGAMWALNAPADVVLDRPPNIPGEAFTQRQLIQNEIDSYPGFERIPTTGRRPATQIAAIQEERGLPVLDWSENIEVQVLNPYLKKQFMLNQQYLDEEIPFKVLGKPIEKMKPEDLVGDFHFFWLGSNQTQSQIIRARQMADFIPLLMQYPPSPTKRPNLDFVLKKLWSEGYGLDGAENLIEELDMSMVIPPDQENIIMALGKQVPIQELDDHALHIQTHSQLLQQPLDPWTRSVVSQHIAQHMSWIQQKQMMVQMSQAAQGQSQQMAGNIAGEPMKEAMQL